MTTPEEFYAKANTPMNDVAPAPWEDRITVVPREWYEKPAPARSWLLRDLRNHDEGVFPVGKVGLLVAEGGGGKTMAIVQLAYSIATGLPWLGSFSVPNAGKVLLVLGEEDAEEVHRRIHRSARVQESDVKPPDGSIVTLPLAGITCPMVEDDGDAAFLVWLREYVSKTGPYALIVVDPISRFCGPDAERDNAAGTRFCQALESLVIPAGGASVLGCHHVNKQSRGAGATVDASSARGSSALTDGVRWVCRIGVEHMPGAKIDCVLKLAVVKSNYSKKPAPTALQYGEGGVLVTIDDADLIEAEAERDQASPRMLRREKEKNAKAARAAEIDEAVVACVEATPGLGASELRIHVKAKAECGPDLADKAIVRMLQARRIRRSEGKTKKHYLVEKVEPRPEEHRATNGHGANGTMTTFHVPTSLEDV